MILEMFVLSSIILIKDDNLDRIQRNNDQRQIQRESDDRRRSDQDYRDYRKEWERAGGKK